LHTIDSEIGDYANEAIELRGMGTTLTALVIHSGVIALLHVGDSRCYRLRGNTIEQLSNDHTVIQELLAQGAITPTEALEHPQRSVLTQALTGDGNVVPLLQLFDAKEGDRYLLCSDGLSGVLTENEIKVLLKKRDRKTAVKEIIDATYIQGAPDNITVLIADITRDEVFSNELLGAAL
jgi:serine/threonine protein phosphatase PrpC